MTEVPNPMEFKYYCPMCGHHYADHGWQQAEKCRNNIEIMKLEKEIREHE